MSRLSTAVRKLFGWRKKSRAPSIRRWIRRSKGPFVVTSAMNLTLLLQKNELVDASIINTGVWEKEQVNALFGHFHSAKNNFENKIFLDIGALWGLYSMFAAKSGEFSKIIAFEPHPLSRAQFHSQLLLNDLVEKIDVRPVALSDKASEFRMRKDNSGNRGAIPIDAKDGEYAVATDKLDNLIQLSNSLIVMKMDVEGHELLALRGATRTLRENRVIAQIECYKQRDVLDEFMAEHGFRKIGEIYPDSYFTNI